MGALWIIISCVYLFVVNSKCLTLITSMLLKTVVGTKKQDTTVVTEKMTVYCKRGREWEWMVGKNVQWPVWRRWRKQSLVLPLLSTTTKGWTTQRNIGKCRTNTGLQPRLQSLAFQEYSINCQLMYLKDVIFSQWFANTVCAQLYLWRSKSIKCQLEFTS